MAKTKRHDETQLPTDEATPAEVAAWLQEQQGAAGEPTGATVGDALAAAQAAEEAAAGEEGTQVPPEVREALRAARKAMLLLRTPEQIRRAEEERTRQEKEQKEREETKGRNLLNGLGEEALEAFLTALQIGEDLGRKNSERLTPEERAALQAAQPLLALLNNPGKWPPPARQALIEGIPEAQNERLRKGLNGWLADRQAQRKEERRREVEAWGREANRPSFRVAMANPGTPEDPALALVTGRYAVKRWDGGQNRLVDLLDKEGNPIERWGAALLAVVAGHRGEPRGQYTGKGNVPFLRKPVPERGYAPLDPARGFQTPYGGGGPSMPEAARLFLLRHWEREGRRQVTESLTDLLEGHEGSATGYLQFNNRGRRGPITVWVTLEEGVLYLTDWQSRVHSLFIPEEGIPLKPGVEEAGNVRFFRIVLEEAEKQQRLFSAYNHMKEQGTVVSTKELLGTPGAWLARHLFGWTTGLGPEAQRAHVALLVENVEGKTLRLEEYFSTNPHSSLEVPVGTSVPVGLDLDEDSGEDEDKALMLQRMLKRCVTAEGGWEEAASAPQSGEGEVAPNPEGAPAPSAGPDTEPS